MLAYPFYNCHSLLNLSFPSVTSLLDTSLRYIFNLEKLEITSTISSVPAYCLPHTYYLKELVMPFTGYTATEGTAHANVMGSLFINSAQTNYYGASQTYSGGPGTMYFPRSLEKITISEQTTIPQYAFQNMQFVKEIILPKATTLNQYCFSGCSLLEHIDMPLVTTIHDCAFNGCASLTEMELPSVTRVGANMFKDATGLK
jgi:hypothetical protein